MAYDPPDYDGHKDSLTLRDLGFFHLKEDIWMRGGDHYEYIAVYVDDLLIASRKPQEIITALETTTSSDL
jgi:hypothetical protein